MTCTGPCRRDHAWNRGGLAGSGAVMSAGPAPRLLSLDLFRGAAVALMILVNNPGSWAHLYAPLAHAPWHGCTPTDLVFPFFLFAVGNALALTMPGYWSAPPRVFWRKWAWRTGLIFLIGLALNASPFLRWDAAGLLVAKPLDGLRVMGVLQRIALCWGAAALLVWALGRRTAARATARVPWVVAALLLGYWALCLAAAGGPDPYSLQGYFGTALDRAVLGAGHLYQGEGVAFEPEGLASTLPAIAQVLLGWWVGSHLLSPVAGAGAQARARGRRRVASLLVIGAALLGLGLVWSDLMPVNKKLWTSSYVLVSSGLAVWMLALLVRWFDPVAPLPGGASTTPHATAVARALRGPAWLLAAFGRNALFVFVLSGLVPRLLSLLRWPDGLDDAGQPHWTTPLPWVHRSLFADLGSDPRLGSLAYAVAHLAVYAMLALWLDRRRIYIKV